MYSIKGWIKFRSSWPLECLSQGIEFSGASVEALCAVIEVTSAPIKTFLPLKKSSGGNRGLTRLNGN